jgi:hypothetical protein
LFNVDKTEFSDLLADNDALASSAFWREDVTLACRDSDLFDSACEVG